MTAAILMVAAVFSCPARAAEPSVSDLQRAIDACSADGAFGLHFGDVRPGAHLQASETPKGWERFNAFAASITTSSQRLFSVMAELDFADESQAESVRHAKATAIVDAAETYITSTHRFVKREVSPYDGSIEHYAEASEHHGYSLWLWLNRYVIMVSCTNNDLESLSWKEGMGDLAKPQARPVAPPKLPLPPRFSETECARPKARDARIAAFAKGQAAMANYSGAVASYLSRLEDTKAAQFVAKGVWSEADESRFALALPDDAQLAAETRHGLSLLKTYTDALGAFDGARKARKPVLACKAAAAADAAGHDIANSSEEQALRILALYGAEAERLGITLE